LEHFEIPGAKGRAGFPTAAKLSGSRFVVLRGAVARVHRALGAVHAGHPCPTEHGLTETWTPVLVKDEAMYGTNQLPKFAEDSYQTTNGWWLIPTSEVTLTNSVAGDILDEAALPIRMTAHTQCFRSEAGRRARTPPACCASTSSRRSRWCRSARPRTALAEHDRMTKCAEAILEKLGLPYRTIVLCTGDMGFGAQKTHDLEVWLPGQNTYREISSVSVCGEFQARRMNARYRPGGRQAGIRATLNGSGLAVGRCLIAVLENGQQGRVGGPARGAAPLSGRRASTAGCCPARPRSSRAGCRRPRPCRRAC
jgi:seryl-tRNA synthetase